MPNLLARWRAAFRPQVYIYGLGSDAPTHVLNYTAAKLYQSQDNLKAVVDYLANSIAQLPLNVYTRNDETDRKRDRTSAAARLLWRPNSAMTEFEFIRAVMTEYFVFGTVYILVLPDADSRSGWQIWPIPSEWVIDTESKNAYMAESITVVAKNSGTPVKIPSTDFVQFKTYSPGNPGGYVSPISALRQTLEEQIQASKFRRQLWSSSGRLNAQILRPANVQPWDDEQRKRFVDAFRESWGSGGSKAGSIPLLEDGMEIKPFSASFKENQWMESVKLSREACAAAYGVNPSLIWHTDTQTYASSKDNARALYAECLGPTLQMLQQRINAFLLPMVGADPDDTYVEFDLKEKLKGSFEERAQILQSAVGGPWMTRNEARADNNLPPVEGGDELIVPLNVIEGGQASPQDTHMDEQEPMAIEENAAPKMLKKAEAEKFRVKARSTKEEDEAMAAVLKDFWKHQANVILSKLGAKAARWWDDDRWNKELADDIEPLINKIADAHGEEVAKAIGSKYITEQTRKYLRALAEGRAKAINDATKKKIQAAIDDEEDEEDTPAHVFEVRENKDSITFGRSLAIGVAGWAATHEAPQQGFHKTVEKRWITGTNPRPEHAMMNGETVPIDAAFSNGCEWPGDENGDVDTTAGCNCSTEVIITVV